MADDATSQNNLPADPIANGEGYQGSDILSRIGDWDRLLNAHWNGWRQEALICYDFVAGRQWTRLEIDEMQSLSRIPIVFNRIAPTIDAVSGAEISNRQQVQYFPRQVGDTAIDDILTQGAEWIMDECEGNEEDSDAFRDALICGIGWCLSGEAMVRLPKSSFATARLYDGPVFDIDLEHGQRLTGTANHPVLTDRGWKALGALQEGDNLIRSSFLERITGLPIEQFDHVETRLEDKVNSFRAAGEGRRFATSSDDFYGDGRGSKVHVVYANRKLWREVDHAARAEKLKQLYLTRWKPRALAVGRRLLLTASRLYGAAFPAEGQFAFEVGHAPNAYVTACQRASDYNAISTEMINDRLGISSDDLTDLHARKAHVVEGYDAANVQVSAATSAAQQPRRTQMRFDLRARYSKFVRDFKDWKPILDVEARNLTGESVTKVVGLNSRHVEGFPVFDIGTSLGFFIAGDILTSNTETRPDFDKDSRITKERIDPLEIEVDPSSRKACFADARYLRRKIPMSKASFREMFPGWAMEGDHDLTSRQPVIVDPRIRYDGTNEDSTVSRDEVIVREYQWYDNEPRHLVGGVHSTMIRGQYPNVPMQDGYVKLTPDQHDELKSRFPDAQTAPIKEKVFYRCFAAGNQTETERLELGDFTYTAMTGKRDRNKNWWYGLVRPMMDPQKWANKLYSQLMHIFRTNANGGVMMEEGAALDQKEFEKTWADPSAVTILAPGALSSPTGKKFEVKPTTAYPEGMDRLMEVAVSAVRDTTGVNQEMLGAADAQAQKAGILEAQRTRQAFGILASFFDGKRRYHKMQGRKLLMAMSLYMPADKLVRVTGSDNNPQYVPLALKRDAAEYDVIVDEAPGGPNQKMQVFQILLQLMPLLQNAGLGAKVWAELARYSPLPAKVAEMIASDLIEKEQAQAQAAPAQQQLQQQAAQAKIADMAGSAAHHNAQAGLLQAKTAETHMGIATGANEPEQPSGLKDEAELAQIQLDRAKTSHLMAQTVSELTEEPKGEK